jgi:two-component system chemotaxis response regulator CheY
MSFRPVYWGEIVVEQESIYYESLQFRFVIIDDAVFIREILRNIAESQGGHCVGEAENGREAVELIKKTLPDLVFLDLVMPIRNGLEILEEIKVVWPDLKIVVCSTLDQPEILDKLKTQGVDAIFPKPFSKNEIENYLSEAFLKGSAKNV